jgi:hypothetical protein
MMRSARTGGDYGPATFATGDTEGRAMSETTWLEALKDGDEVVIRHRYGMDRHGMRLVKVTKITPTQIVANGSRFRRDTGWERGGSVWDSTSLLEATPERRKAIAVDSARSFLAGTNWKTLKDEDVLAIAETARQAVPRC